MAIVNPYRSLRFNHQKVGSMSDIIVPPYDVIPAGEEKNYWNRSLYNFGHVSLARREEDDYSQSAATLKKWRELGVVTEDATPGFYLYEQVFSANGATHHRRTLMGAVMLADYGDGQVLPHEITHGKHKKGQLQLMKATQAQLSHVFGMVKDPEGFLAKVFEEVVFHTAVIQAKDDAGVGHTLWRLPDKYRDSVSAFFKDKSIYIVDGHHRYESSLMYAKEIGAKDNPNHPASQMMFAIANVYDPGLVVFPTHRWVKNAAAPSLTLDNISRAFHLSDFPADRLNDFCSHPRKEPEFVLYFDNRLYLCQPRATMGDRAVQQLAVYWSDTALLTKLAGIAEQERSHRIKYEKTVAGPWEGKTPSDLIVFHAPPKVESVTSVADQHDFMPQKSTYFIPKLAAGLSFRDISTP